MLFRHVTPVFLIVALMVSQGGCTEIRKATKKTWHEKFNWKAELYFDDAQVIALCKAIEEENLEEIDRLVAGGADVNAKGKGNMTPLMWAYPDDKPERFKRLLEHGADPNVIFEDDFNTGGKVSFRGRSVTHMASKTWFAKYFDYVFQYGGDPNLRKSSLLGRGETPLLTLIGGGAADKKAKIRRLIELGADLDQERATGMLPIRLAAGRAQYDIVLLLLNAGANHRKHKKEGDNSRLVHKIIAQERELPHYSPQRKEDYQKLVEWLKDHGEDFDEARADRKRWRSWSTSRKSGLPSEYRRKMDAEIAARKAREAQEKKGSEKTAKPVAVQVDEKREAILQGNGDKDQ